MDKGRLGHIVQSESLEWGDNAALGYHHAAAGDMDAQWASYFVPFQKRFDPDLRACADFAAGFGRNTRKLLAGGAHHVTMIDVNPDCIERLSQTLSGPGATPFRNSGYDLAGLGGDQFSFFYSFDAMVHFDLELVLAYMPEIFRTMRPGALAFLHHSNHTGNPGGDFRQSPHWRNYMSADLFKHIAIKSGFDVVQQEVIAWGEPDLDCITVLKKP